MSTALPILNHLQEASNRQEGRDIERLESTKKFRFWVTTLIAILAIISALYVGLQGVVAYRHGMLSPKTTGQTYNAHMNPPQDAANSTPYHEGYTQ